VTSSSTCLDPSIAADKGVIVVPLHVVIDGKDYRDFNDITPAEVYRALLAGASVTTSSSTVGEFVEAYRQARGPVICLTEAPDLSTMPQAAALATELIEDRQVMVLPTRTAAGGLRLLALAAARMATDGADLDAITDRIRRLDRKVCVFGALDTLKFLARSGRVPQVASWVTSSLRMGPVIRFIDGKGSLVRMVRSADARTGAVEQLALRYAQGSGADPDGAGVVGTVFHAQAATRAEDLLSSLHRRLPAADLDMSEFTPAMGAHTGPGVVGVAICHLTSDARPG